MCGRPHADATDARPAHRRADDHAAPASGTPVLTVSRSAATLTGHTVLVYAVAWSPDGRTLASGSSDNTVRLWATDGAPIRALTDHTNSVTALPACPTLTIQAMRAGAWHRVHTGRRNMVRDPRNGPDG